MQEEGGKKGVNPALEKHWEKIVLGAVVLLALIFLGSKFSGGGSTAPKSVDGAVADFKRKIDAQNPKIEGPKEIPQPKVASPAIANRAPDFAIGERTKYAYDITRSKEELRVYKFPDVSLGSPAPSPEGVTITWNVTKFEKEQNLKKGDPIPVMPPYFYKVERREKGGAWAVLQEVMKTDKDNFSPKYTDINIKPKTDYEYRVTVGTQDKNVAKDIPTGLAKTSASPVSVTTLGIWRFEFNNFTAGDPDREPQPLLPTVWVKITKYDPDAGEVSWTRIHKEGKPLGFDENGTSVHGVYSEKKKRQLSVDFNCGGKIEKILFEKPVSYEYQVCNVKQGPQGPVCAGPEKVKDVYKVNEITYTDEDGKKQTHQAAASGRNSDKLCQDHGGAPPPKELSPDERKAQRETEATRMLDEADTLWVSDKPTDKKKAQGIYKKLIDSFGDTDAVKPRKSQIADRSK